MSEKWDLGTAEDLGDLRAFWNSPVYRAMRAFTGGKGSAESHAPGKKLLCATCDLVAHPHFTPGRLSPLPPSFQAAGMGYEHGLDSVETRQLG